MKIFYSREEGQNFLNGFNYTKTCNGHGLQLQICLLNGWRLRFGYYWGIGFNWKLCFFNQHTEDKILSEFLK